MEMKVMVLVSLSYVDQHESLLHFLEEVSSNLD